MTENDLIQSRNTFELFPDLLKTAEEKGDGKKTEMMSDPEEKKASESPEKPAAATTLEEESCSETPITGNKTNVAVPESVRVYNNDNTDDGNLVDLTPTIQVVTGACTSTPSVEPLSPSQQKQQQNHHQQSSSDSPQSPRVNQEKKFKQPQQQQEQQGQQPQSTPSEKNDEEEPKKKETGESNMGAKEEDTKMDQKDPDSSNQPTAHLEERGQYQITLQVPMPMPVQPPPPPPQQQQLEQQEPIIERQPPSPRGRPQLRTTRPAPHSASHNVYSSNASTTEIVHSMFGTSVGLCWGDFSCQYNHIRGRLYASTEAVLFYSNLFGFEKKLCLRYDDILQMELYRSTSIQISVEEKPVDNNKIEDNNRENDNSSVRTTNSFNNSNIHATYNYVFKAFADRIETLQLLIDLWRKSQGDDNIESHDDAATDAPPSLEAPSLLEALTPARSLSPLFGGEEDKDETSSFHSQRQQQHPTQSQEPPINPPVPPSILRSSKLSTPPTKPSAPPAPTTTPRKLFSESFTGSKRSRSLPPLHRRKRVERSNSDGVADGNAESASGASGAQGKDELDLDQKPTESDRAAWEASKNSAAPCIKDVGIEPVTLPCSLGTFFRLFLADDAPYSIDKYQRGDAVKSINVKISPWEKDPSENAALARTFEFDHPVSKALGVGSHAPTKKRSRLRRYPGCGLCFTNTTTVKGLPGTDCFVLEDQWLVEAVPATESSTPQVILSTRFGPNFTKYTFLKSIITKNVRSGNKEWFEGYKNMVQAALQENANKNGAMATGLPPSGILSAIADQKKAESNLSHQLGIFDSVGAKALLVLLVAFQFLLVLCLIFALIELRASHRFSQELMKEMKELRLEQSQLMDLIVKKDLKHIVGDSLD